MTKISVGRLINLADQHHRTAAIQKGKMPSVDIRISNEDDDDDADEGIILNLISKPPHHPSACIGRLGKELEVEICS